MELFNDYHDEGSSRMTLYGIIEEKEFEICSRLTEELMETRVNQLTEKFYLTLGKLIWEGNKFDHATIERIIHSNERLREVFYEKINNEVTLMAYQDRMKKAKDRKK